MGSSVIACYLLSYSSPAARAVDELNLTPLNNKPVRIMYYNRDPSSRKTGTANIFIKNLDKTIDHKALHYTFSAFGNILSCKLATDASAGPKDVHTIHQIQTKCYRSISGTLID
ncbi:hypothetical protein K1719_032084 [Acacia pycnantha]|nr:hypothetical protein K1719_032084 [Acacia pycnantha]